MSCQLMFFFLKKLECHNKIIHWLRAFLKTVGVNDTVSEYK